MTRTKLIAAGVLALALLGYGVLRPTTSPEQTAPQQTAQAAPAAPTQPDALVSVTLPDSLSPEAQLGKRAFEAVCAACHGQNGAGRAEAGPPLIHKIYEPSHHGDMAFQLAAAQGVRAHHWRFGDMPAQPQVTQSDVKAITAYIREVQRANGIF